MAKVRKNFNVLPLAGQRPKAERRGGATDTLYPAQLTEIVNSRRVIDVLKTLAGAGSLSPP